MSPQGHYPRGYNYINQSYSEKKRIIALSTIDCQFPQYSRLVC